jgi:hypothetical protein
MHRKMDITIQGNCGCIQPAYRYRTELTGKPSPPFERVYIYGAENTLIL